MHRRLPPARVLIVKGRQGARWMRKRTIYPNQYKSAIKNNIQVGLEAPGRPRACVGRARGTARTDQLTHFKPVSFCSAFNSLQNCAKRIEKEPGGRPWHRCDRVGVGSARPISGEPTLLEACKRVKASSCINGTGFVRCAIVFRKF